VRFIGTGTSFGLALVMVMCGAAFLFAARYYPFAIALCVIAFVAASAFGTIGIKQSLLSSKSKRQFR
jgi:hypothetical protein